MNGKILIVLTLLFGIFGTHGQPSGILSSARISADWVGVECRRCMVTSVEQLSVRSACPSEDEVLSCSEGGDDGILCECDGLSSSFETPPTPSPLWSSTQVSPTAPKRASLICTGENVRGSGNTTINLQMPSLAPGQVISCIYIYYAVVPGVQDTPFQFEMDVILQDVTVHRKSLNSSEFSHGVEVVPYFGYYATGELKIYMNLQSVSWEMAMSCPCSL